MNTIKLNAVYKNMQEIRFDYAVHGEIEKYFTSAPFKIEYPDCVEEVPDSIAVIPFVCNVLPIVWLNNATLIVSELDKTFYESIPNFKQGYINMFPEADFRGNVVVNRVVENHYPHTGKSAMFYSGGLDSAQTLISHLDEKPVLLAVWGSDIRYDNESGWKPVYQVITDTAHKFNLQEGIIHSTFREFDNEGLLSKDFFSKLQDGWWHGVKHSLALLGHIAPYVWLHHINTMYIAASFCAADRSVKCASDPTIDNYVSFSECKVVHDGYEYSRQDKVHNLVEFCKSSGEYFPLHVCWLSQSGSNCCCCEKCYRTMAGLWMEGEDPANYGFGNTIDALKNMQLFIKSHNMQYKSTLYYQWPYIRKRAVENKKIISKKAYYKYLKWILKADFEHPESLKLPLWYRIRSKLSNFKFYQMLHKIKEKCMGK